jgi:hypothetical protein
MQWASWGNILGSICTYIILLEMAICRDGTSDAVTPAVKVGDKNAG